MPELRSKSGWIIAALFLTLAAGAAAAAEPSMPPAASGRESLSAIIARWNTHVEQFKTVPRDERVRETKLFFRTIPWDNLEYLCWEGSPGVGPDSTDVMRYVMSYRLEVEPPPVAVMADFIANADFAMACRFPFLVWAFQHRDSLSADERSLLAAAQLTAASFPGIEEYFKEQFYLGVVALVATDSLMAGMMGWARSGDEMLAGRGVRMLASSMDPRSPDSLASLADDYYAARSPVLDVLLVQCRRACAARALPVFISAAGNPRTPEQRVSALEAIGRVPTPEAAAAILAQYADGGTIADSTFATKDERRAHYYALWIATRVAEPHLNTWLRVGDEEEADLAIELLDRALRFGPPDGDDEVIAALGAWAERAPPGKAERARAVRERGMNPPQKGRPGGGASAPGDSTRPAEGR
jgi:hypothetical protein